MSRVEKHPTWVVADHSYSEPAPIAFTDHAFPNVDHALRAQGWIPRHAERYVLTVSFVDLAELPRLDQRAREVVASRLPSAQDGALQRLEGLVRERQQRGQHMPDLGDVTDRFTEVARASMPTVALYYQRDDETLEVVVHDLTVTPTAELYADLVLREGSVVATPLGRGYANGPSAVVHIGDGLVRATWSGTRHLDSAAGMASAERQGELLLHAG